MTNKIFNLLISFLLLLTFVSCGNKEKNNYEKIVFPKTLRLNLSEAITDSMNLSEIAEKIEYIPLQTSDSSVIDFAYHYAVTKDYFFVKNELGILKFDKNGRFLNNLFKVGRGPGEAFARCIAADEHAERVYVYDNKIYDVKVYDYNGTYIKTITKPIAPLEYWVYSIGFFNNNLFVHTAQRPFVKYLYSCFDLSNDSIRILCKNYREYDKSQEGKPPMAPNDFHYQITDSTILYKERFCDTIFKVNKDFSREPRYIIDLGNRKLDWLGWRDHGMFDIPGGPPFGYQVQSFVETRSFLFMVLTSFKEPELFALYDKNKNSVKIYKDCYEEKAFKPIYLKNDLDKLAPFPPMDRSGYLLYHDGCFYSAIYAKDFVKAYNSASEKTRNSSRYLKNMAPVFNKITEFSNPVIMKVTLK